MIYKPFGNTGINMSTLGFGAMRLPMTETNGVRHVDYDKSTPLLRRAFELGVNYLDTAPGYCGQDSEVACGKALKGFRDKVYLSTKNPIENASGDDWRKRLEGSLKKLDTDYIDFYHMWGIDLETYRTKVDVPGGPLEAARKALDEGLIKHLSFSFHDDPKNMIPIIDSGMFESVLCQYNLLDQANADGMAYARQKGLGVVIMGPVGGGRLGAPSDVVKGMLGRDVQSTAEMALRFVLANPNVNIALSGMENIQMLEENARVASIEGPLTGAELSQVHAMLEENKRLMDLYCTGCKYCMPCPHGINIPHCFTLMNYHRVYGLTGYAKAEMRKLDVPVAERANDWEQEWGEAPTACVECGACEEKCPQKLKIIAQLKETVAALA